MKIPVRAEIDIVYECIREDQGNGTFVVTFPGFPEMKSFSFPIAADPHTVEVTTKSALADAIFARLSKGESLPVPVKFAHAWGRAA